MADLKSLVMEYLTIAKLMQIATVKSSRPWVASVWYTNDDAMNLYFISRKARRHSLEIKDNPNVAGTIVVPHVIGSGEKVRGLQFEGIAGMCIGDQALKAKQLYTAKYPRAEDIPAEKLADPDFTVAYYVVMPKLFVLFDEINFPDQPRQELPV